MLSLKGLDHLSKRAVESQRRLTELVERSAVPIDGYVAWGQFLDAPRKAGQYGLYGTSAAIQVLAASGHSANSPLISKALAALPEIEANRQNKILYDETDLLITFKEAAILEAAQPDKVQFVNKEPIETILLNQLIDRHGWGNYSDANDQDDSPRLLPTAHALIALRRSRDFRGSEVCETILAWLCDSAISQTSMAIHEAAMVLLTLIEYESPGVKLASFQPAYQHILSQIISWTRTRPKSSIGETTSYHYWVRSKDQQHNHYVYYVPDILVALALLRAGNPKAGRSQVTRVVDNTCSEIFSSGGFQAKASQRIATVDQMWAYRLLGQFNTTFNAKPADLVSPAAYLVSATPTRRVITSLALLAVGVGGTLVSTLSWVNLVLRTLGGATAVVALGIVASLFFVWLRGE